MEEIIDEFNFKGEKIGSVSRSIAHKEGRWHKSIHAWIINDKNEILLQLRSKKKRLFANMWDCSFAGHVDSGETTFISGIREAKEEIGIDIDINSFEYLTTVTECVKTVDVTSNEFVDIYVLKQNIDIKDIKVQEDEVEEVKYVPLEEFYELIENQKLVPHTNEYEILKSYLKNNQSQYDLKKSVRTIENFPKEGIMFRDITSVLNDSDAFNNAINKIRNVLSNVDFNVVVGPESRGFIFGCPVAYSMNKRFVPVRKPGKLPGKTISQEYALEYGTDKLEIHADAIKPGDKVVIIDDLLATGGTMEAITKLIEKLGGSVEKICCLIDLPELGGKEKLENYDVECILSFMEDEK